MTPLIPPTGMLRIAQNIAMKKMNGRILEIESGTAGEATVRDCKSIRAAVDAWERRRGFINIFAWRPWKNHDTAHVIAMSENKDDKKQKVAR